MLKHILVSLGISVVVVALGLSLFTSEPSIVEVERIAERVSERIAERMGAFSGPEISSPYLAINEVRDYYYSGTFANATSTLCSFRLPPATTTLVTWDGQITTATTVAVDLHLDNSAGSGNATQLTATSSTNLITANVAADVLGELSYRATTTGMNTKNVFGPNRYLVLGVKRPDSIADAGVSTDVIGDGFCKAQVRIVNNAQ